MSDCASRCSADLFELVKSAVEIIQLIRKRRITVVNGHGTLIGRVI